MRDTTSAGATGGPEGSGTATPGDDVSGLLFDQALDELRSDVRARLEAAAEAGVRREFRAAAVDKAVENATGNVPCFAMP